MKERPILFNSEMVRAILDGRKTQTRRAVKLKNGYARNGADIDAIIRDSGARSDACPYGKVGDCLWVRETFGEVYEGRQCYIAPGRIKITERQAERLVVKMAEIMGGKS